MARAITATMLAAVTAVSLLAQEGTRQNSGTAVLTAALPGPNEPKELEAWMDQFLSDYRLSWVCAKTPPPQKLG